MMFEFTYNIFLNKFFILFLFIIKLNTVRSYGPTHYRPLWEGDGYFHENEISNPVSHPVLHGPHHGQHLEPNPEIHHGLHIEPHPGPFLGTHPGPHLPMNPFIHSSKLPSFGVVPQLLTDLSVGKFQYQREYSPKLSQIYSQYLRNDYYSQKCAKGLTKPVRVTAADFMSAFRVADKQIKDYEIANQLYLAEDPRGFNFSAYIYVSGLHAKYNEFVTEYLSKKKCYDKYKIAVALPFVQMPAHPWNNQKYCDIEKPNSPFIKCNPKKKFSRLDGKCNNLVHSNWGSSDHCHRRLLPPDYADGIEIPRRAFDGSELPNPRLITETYMPDIPLEDPKRTSMHMSWGQFLVHDTFKTIQYFGLAIRCCTTSNTPAHPECFAISNIPEDEASPLSHRRNARCINFVRSSACNTCSLGPRNQINGATSTLDLSNVYGGNHKNSSSSLRTYYGGSLRVSIGRDGNDILPRAQLPRDQDTTDLTPCNPPLDRPWLTCFHNGDGIRGNQNPMVNSIHVMMTRRHNQHAEALLKVNPHWSDERLFQESRRILIAEYNKINFGEYMPSLLGKYVMHFFELDVKKDGYTKYNPKLDPSTIQAVGVAGMRMGHSQVASLFRIIDTGLEHLQQTFGFSLRNKFFEMSDIYDGYANGILKGLVEESDRNVDPFIVTDVKDFLFFNPRMPSLSDLPALNINRGRDHGVPGYVNYLQYCTGVHIKSWTDLHRFIPGEKIMKLRNLYKHYKDIDLFVGGLSEVHLSGSILGPTFSCLNAIQFYHWKYGDRFYFEHGSQAGSFNPGQLKSLRQTSSLANLLCKTTGFESIQMHPMFVQSLSNPKIDCHTLPDLDYNLWRDKDYYK